MVRWKFDSNGLRVRLIFVFLYHCIFKYYLLWSKYYFLLLINELYFQKYLLGKSDKHWFYQSHDLATSLEDDWEPTG